MNISRLQYAEFSQSYGIDCSRLSLIGERDGMYPTFCRILPDQSTIHHAHYEPELFYIIQGSGMMTVNNETAKVSEGDLIRIPAFANHVLKNIGTEELTFLSVYSEDIETPALPKMTVITSAPPTPNGPLHLGHISGPYLASDVLTRYLRLHSHDVRNVCGTDDHQNYVYEKAQTLSIPVDDFQRVMRASIQQGFAHMNIVYDEFIEPKDDKIYQNRVLDFVQRAINLNIIKYESVKFPYCESCNLMLVDATIYGNCPCCGEVSRGACEQCGMVVPPYDLQNACCSRCHQPANQKITSLYTFELSEYFSAIQYELSQLRFSSRVQELIQRVKEMKNFKMMLTHPSQNKQGIYLPNTDQVAHVWLEMAANYEQFSLNQTTWVNCFGFDNSFYYLIFIPSLLRAMNQKTKLPEAVITNDFLQLDGIKFSTSRDYAVWVNEFTGNIDHLRLFLLVNRPSHYSSDFSMVKFEQFSYELEEQLQRINQSARQIVDSKKAPILPQKMIDCNRATRNMENYLSPVHIDFRRASRELLNFIDLVLQSTRTGYSEKLMLHTLAILMAPFMPNESKRLLNSLKITTSCWIKDWSNLYAIT